MFPNGIAFLTDGTLVWTESFSRRVMAMVDGQPEVVVELPERTTTACASAPTGACTWRRRMPTASPSSTAVSSATATRAPMGWRRTAVSGGPTSTSPTRATARCGATRSACQASATGSRRRPSECSDGRRRPSARTQPTLGDDRRPGRTMVSDFGSSTPPDPYQPGSSQPPPPPPPPYGQSPLGQPPRFGSDQTGVGGGAPPPNYLVWAILTTIFCCLPFGIVSIVFAAQVNGKYAGGDYAGAARLVEQGQAVRHLVGGGRCGGRHHLRHHPRLVRELSARPAHRHAHDVRPAG